MPTLRNSPYCWVTWLTPLLSGENHCEYSTWFRAHYSGYEKVERSFDQAKWTSEHNAMVHVRAQELRDAGYEVYVEKQNSFALHGQNVAFTLGGSADIVAIRHRADDVRVINDALVIDCKSGQQKDKDIWQVLLYMLCLPQSVPHCKGLTFRGEVEYRGNRIAIAPGRLTADVKQMIRSTIERLASSETPRKVPSTFECKFCDITKADCNERVDESEACTASTDLW